MSDHRRPWGTGGEPPELPPYVPPQNINLNITITLSPETATLLHGLNSGILAAINLLQEGQTKMQADVQKAVDNVAKLTSVVASNNAAWKVMADLNTTQAGHIKELEDKIANGTELAPDDLAALKQSNDDGAAAITALQTNLPANTPAAP